MHMKKAGEFLTFTDICEAIKHEMLMKGGFDSVPSELHALYTGACVLGETLDDDFIDIPYKSSNHLFHLTVPYLDDHGVVRGDNGVTVLRVKTFDGVTVDLVYYAFLSRHNKPVHEFRLKSVNSPKLNDDLVLKLVGNRIKELSPILVDNAKLTRMINKF